MQFDNVSVLKKANVYFDGKCVSHTVILNGGVRKSVGVILPSTVKFATDTPEIVEIVSGKCRVRIGNTDEWRSHEGGQRFQVPGQSSFEIEAIEPVHYVCHFSN